jgi:ABC-type glycerol-3-phosphate transport system substrate-binding protein
MATEWKGAPLICAAAAALVAACGPREPSPVVTFAASVVGQEAAVLSAQFARFQARRPDVRVEVRATPDAADTRHQLYVQRLNAHVPDPDVLQIDVIWTPEFAAAEWILPLDGFRPPADDFLPAAIAANRWNGRLFALPWFVDVGMLYWRTDLASSPPRDFDELRAQADRRLLSMGLVWQGARYEGLVTVFLEYLTAFGGQILDAAGRVVVDADPAVRAVEYMRDAIYVHHTVPVDVLAWQEEHTRFAFQNGRARFMRNWPYAVTLLRDPARSSVAGRFAVAPMPAGPGGSSAAALGGSQLAINAHTDQPDAAYALIAFLLEPEQMLERARVVGQYPSRMSLYDGSLLETALGIPAQDVRAIIERATPRPVTPVYSELSDVLQIHLHRALTRQAEPREALANAAADMRRVLERSGLTMATR